MCCRRCVRWWVGCVDAGLSLLVLVPGLECEERLKIFPQLKLQKISQIFALNLNISHI